MKATNGFTLVELLVGAALASVVAGALFTLMNQTIKGYHTDNARINVNQNLQSSLLMITNDIRQAGEGVTGFFPAIVVTPATGNSSTSISIRRSLIDSILPVCDDINSGSNQDNIPFAEPSANKQTASCQAPDMERVAPWENYRKENGGSVKAYIFDPVTKQGEFFVYDAIDSSGFKIHKDNIERWTYDYKKEHTPMMLILEERVYSIQDKQLTLQINGGEVMPVAPKVTALSTAYNYKDGSTGSGLFPPDATGTGSAKNWKDLASIDVTISGMASVGSQERQRTFTERVSPRNSYSGDK